MAFTLVFTTVLLGCAICTDAAWRLRIDRMVEETSDYVRDIVCEGSRIETYLKSGSDSIINPNQLIYRAKWNEIKQLKGSKMETLENPAAVEGIVKQLLKGTYSYELSDAGEYNGKYTASEIEGSLYTGILGMKLTKEETQPKPPSYDDFNVNTEYVSQ